MSEHKHIVDDVILGEGCYVHPSSYVDHGVKLGSDTKIWHFSHILPYTQIGERCSFGQNCVVGPNVAIGNNVKVQNNVSIYDGVICEDDVFLGPSMVFTNVINPRSHVNRKAEFKKTILRKGSSVGANATIVCGNEIGAYAMIGAGAVITKPVKAFALMAGVPARQMGWVDMFGEKLDFTIAQIAYDEAGNSYRLRDDIVEMIKG